MSYSLGKDWHYDIILEANAQIVEISLKVFSLVFPGNIYNISWSTIRQNGAETQIPIDAAKIGLSDLSEQVQLAYEVTYY